MLESVTNNTELRTLEIALRIAEAFGVQRAFWDGMLTSLEDPESANGAASIAIRMFINTSTKFLGPVAAVAQITELLLNPSSTWDSLDLPSVNAQSIGQDLTAQLKANLLALVATYSDSFLEGLATEIAGELE